MDLECDRLASVYAPGRESRRRVEKQCMADVSDEGQTMVYQKWRVFVVGGREVESRGSAEG